MSGSTQWRCDAGFHPCGAWQKAQISPVAIPLAVKLCLPKRPAAASSREISASPVALPVAAASAASVAAVMAGAAAVATATTLGSEQAVPEADMAGISAAHAEQEADKVRAVSAYTSAFMEKRTEGKKPFSARRSRNAREVRQTCKNHACKQSRPMTGLPNVTMHDLRADIRSLIKIFMFNPELPPKLQIPSLISQHIACQ